MRTLFFIGFYLYVFAVLNSCASLNSEMILVYTDQNNNRYTITANEIEYKAIQPEESSSGIYSGGTDKIAPISSGDFKKINSISELLFKEKSSHAIRREMMTSVLKRNYHGKSEQVILYTSENRTAFEILLKDLTTN
tara:strand:+ start:3799 stop:4209 length:411 start_codon:yes stop_codon:yes gene_type:complete